MTTLTLTFDANVFFYAVDSRDREKHARCAAILRAAIAQSVGFVTLQALGEFSHAVVRKAVLSRREAAQAAKDWATVFDARSATPGAFDLALDWWADERLSYWDALLVATASKEGARACVSEDLRDGAVIGGVEIVSPFAASADGRLAACGLDLQAS